MKYENFKFNSYFYFQYLIYNINIRCKAIKIVKF